LKALKHTLRMKLQPHPPKRLPLSFLCLCLGPHLEIVDMQKDIVGFL